MRGPTGFNEDGIPKPDLQRWRHRWSRSVDDSPHGFVNDLQSRSLVKYSSISQVPQPLRKSTLDYPLVK